MKLKILSRLLILLCLSLPLFVEAANRAACNVTYDIAARQRLILNPNHLSIRPTTEADFNQSFLDVPNALNLDISSNTAWKLELKSTSPNLNSQNKPIEDLLWKNADNSTYNSVKTTNSLVTSASEKSKNTTISLDLRLNLSWITDHPGTYETTLVFTLGSNV